MHAMESNATTKALNVAGADLEIRTQLVDNNVTIDILKSGARVHRLTIEDAVGRMEHGWIADLFAREDRIALSQITRDAEDYISQLNINQG